MPLPTRAPSALVSVVRPPATRLATLEHEGGRLSGKRALGLWAALRKLVRHLNEALPGFSPDLAVQTDGARIPAFTLAFP